MKKVKNKTSKVLRCYEVHSKTKLEQMEKHTSSQITKILQKNTHIQFCQDLDKNLHRKFIKLPNKSFVLKISFHFIPMVPENNILNYEL